MATRRVRLKYYVEEWARHLGLSNAALAEKVGVSRATIGKWFEQGLKPDHINRIAAAMDIHPNDLLFPPDTPSLDAIADGASKEQRAAMIGDIVRRLKQAGQ